MDQIQRKPNPSLFRCILASAWLMVFLAACGSATPQNTAVPATPAASPSATFAGSKPFPVSSALLSPADLNFNEAYPAAGWQRCDDYTMAKNLDKLRTSYKVTGSAAATWEYANECGSNDQPIHLDEYAWLLQSETAAADLRSALIATSYVNQMTPMPGERLMRFERDGVLVRALPIKTDNGQKLYAAEIVGQDGAALTMMRIATEVELTDDNYVALARLLLDRLHAGQAAP